MEVKEFKEMAAITKFCNEYYIPETIQLDDDIRKMVMQFQSRYITAERNKDIVLEIAALMDLMPEAPFDFVIYRGGSNKKKTSRPFVSSSFFKSVAKKYSDPLMDPKKIIVRKGAKIIPLLAINLPLDIGIFNGDPLSYKRGFGDPEGEIILDAAKIRWRGAYYEYR